MPTTAIRTISLVAYGQHITGISFAIGESVNLLFACQDPNTRAAFDLTGGNVIMSICALNARGTPIQPPVIPRQATIVGLPTLGNILVPIGSSDTIPSGVPIQPGVYGFDLFVTDASGNRLQGLGFGNIAITPSATLPGTPVVPLPSQVPLAQGASGDPRLIPTAVKTANYTAIYNDLVRCDPTAGTFTVTLPAASAAVFGSSDWVVIKHVSGSANQITVTPAGADTIDGVAGSITIATRQQLMIVANGTSDWMILLDRFITIPDPGPSDVGKSVVCTNNNPQTLALAYPTLAASGVTPGTYTNTNLTVGADGRLTAAANGAGGGGGGTVTSITMGTGLSSTQSPLTTTGTMSLANTAVTPGAYTNANITVDAQGRLTAAANGAGGAGGTLKTTYDGGAAGADQTMTVATAKGGAIVAKDDATYTGSLMSVTNNGGTVKYLDITNNGGQTYTSAVADGAGVYGHTFNDIPALTTGFMARFRNNSVTMAQLQDTTSAVVLDMAGRNIAQLTSSFGGTTANVTVTSNTSAELAAFGANVKAATNIVTIAAPVTFMNSAYKVKRTTVADVPYTVLAADYYIEYTTLTATRAVTLPTAVLGQIYVVVDGVGTANTNNITFSSASTISGLTTINTAFGVRTFYGTTSRWIGY